MAIGTTIKVDGDAQRIGQLVWMLFLKILDDREIEKETARKRYRSPIPDHLRWQAWAGDADSWASSNILGTPKVMNIFRGAR